MKFIDWFAGIGGFRKGMEEAGHQCVGFCEFDKFAVASYTSMHLITDEQREYLATLDIKKRQKEILKEEYRNGEWFADDIRSVDARNIPTADCWCFGFPCQDISVAGKQLGFTGNRSSLFFRVMYLVGQLEEEKRPTFLFIENVKNLLSVNGGWDFSRLLIEMDRGGYDAEWQILNSKHFGVPQNRERCFIIGHLRGRSTAEIFPVEGTNAADHIYGVGHRRGYRRNTQVFDQEGITETLDTGAGGGRGHHTIITLNKEFKHEHERVLDGGGIVGTLLARDYKDAKRVAIPISYAKGKVKKEIDVAHCLSAEGPAKEGTMTHQSVNRVAVPVLTPDRANKRQNGRRFKEDGEEAFTLTSQDRHGVAVGIDVHECVKHPGIYVQISENLTVYAVWYPKKQCYVAIRKLTPKECFRLQGWSDDYFEKAQFVNSDSQLYKQAGNGVTVSVIREIAKKMEGTK